VRAFRDTVFDVIEQEPGAWPPAGGDWDRREAGEADRCRLGRAEGDPRDHAVSTQHGVGTSRAVLIYTTYSAEAVQRISENPRRLARDIRDIGFRTADQIAAKLGIEKGRADPRAPGTS
jgi:exodeoxyribonuclease V alpha subunit